MINVSILSISLKVDFRLLTNRLVKLVISFSTRSVTSSI